MMSHGMIMTVNDDNDDELLWSVFSACQILSFKGLAPIEGCYILEDFSSM